MCLKITTKTSRSYLEKIGYNIFYVIIEKDRSIHDGVLITNFIEMFIFTTLENFYWMAY